MVIVLSINAKEWKRNGKLAFIREVTHLNNLESVYRIFLEFVEDSIILMLHTDHKCVKFQQKRENYLHKVHIENN